MATDAGRRIVEMVWEDLKPTRHPDRGGVRQCHHVVDMAIGGSTNAIIHLIAMARPRRHRRSISIDFDAARATHAGARQPPAVGRVPDGGLLLRRRPARRCCTQLGDLLASRLPHGQRPDARREHRRRRGLQRRRHPAARQALSRPTAALAVLRGNLAPDGAVIKPTAAEPRLLKHTGPAVVFNDYNDLKARIDDPTISTSTPDSRAGAAERRPARRPGHAGMGHAADPEEAARSRACATWCASPTRG